MEEKSIKKLLDMNEWREIVNNWNKNDESQKTYCDRLGISLNTFTYVRVKLQKKIKSERRFASLKVINGNEDKILEQSNIILENSRGYKLHFPTSLSLEQLVKLFKLSGWNNA